MLETFAGWSPVMQALAATTFTWGLTALGAGAVFFFRDVSRKALDTALGFTAGVMIAASFWSLLNPAIALSEEMGMVKWIPPLVGFLTGAFSMRLVDYVLPHVHLFGRMEEAEGVKTRWQRTTLLVLAITLHNLPAGAAGFDSASFSAAVALAIGIGIQNCPEGTAVAVPLRREGLSRFKAWWYGQLSATVEPVAAVIGALAVTTMRPILPYALAFAAGAMIFVVVEEVIPESQRGGNGDLATLGTMVGFAVMMTLDVALG